MFYVKEKINEVMEVRIEVGSDNVYGYSLDNCFVEPAECYYRAGSIRLSS